MIGVVIAGTSAAACAWACAALSGESGARLVVLLASRHRSCYKVHPDMPHTEWVEKIHDPVSARFLARRGYGKATS